MVLLGLASLVAGCTSGSAGSGSAGSGSAGSGAGGSASTAAERDPATSARSATTAVRRYTASVTGEHEVSPGYRQGLARSPGGGWVFSTNNGLYRTDDAYVQNGKAEQLIPADLVAQGYNHIGDIDIADGVLWAPIEKDDKASGRQVMARFDPDTFAFLGAEEVPQHHASFAAADAGILYSTDYFDDDTILRYRWDGQRLEPLAPLKMTRTVGHIQGADVADGALWLSTDDDHDGVYRVDLTTGAVTDLGSMGHTDGEGEGIDATPLASGLLHALSIDARLVPVRVVDLSVSSG